MLRYSIEPAKYEHFVEFYGHGPKQTCRAWTVKYDGEIAAIAGVTINRKSVVLFSDINSERDYPKTAIYKVGCYIVEHVSRMGLPVMAVGSEKSRPFLEALGFYYLGKYQDQELYRLWQS